MPLYDRRCDGCGFRRDDCYEQPNDVDYGCKCGDIMRRIPVTSNPGAGFHAHGDECDVTMKHGLCNPDGTPRRYTSKTEMAREAKKRGLTNYVEHKPGRSSDRCKETQRWV
jgi:hypothetical protein